MASNGHKRPITRRRDHLACIECRKKKLKCDRAAPCSACTRRDGGISCSYQKSTTGFEAERERRKRAEGRLEHLQQMVQELSKSGRQGEPPINGAGSQSASTVTPTNGSSTQESGTANDSAIDAVYNGATHWSAMLEDIEELRSAINVHIVDTHSSPPGELSESMSTDDSGILFGTGPTLTFDQVLNTYLPSRQESDRLVATYFRSKAVKAPFFHHAHFQKRYLAFWAEPTAAPVLWTSIMFSVFHASTTSLAPNVIADNKFARAAAHCLAIGKHYQPRQYAVEALVFYTQTKCFTQIDLAADVGSLLGLATRAAIRMGYHRDPARLSISPFEKEMRRRVWSTLLQLELLISFQLGFPSSILPGSWDTAIPSNINDADFDEDSLAIPPERPDTEETDTMFYNAKHKLSIAFEQVHQHVSSTSSANFTTESTLTALEAHIHRAFHSLPTQYRQKPVSASIFDSPTLIVARFCVNMIYEKCLCVLHRPYVAAGRRASILACHQASTNILSHFTDAYEEFRPQGQVEMQKWFMSGITWHDFLLGATAMCLVLCSAQRHEMLGAPSAEVDLQAAMGMLQRAKGVLGNHSAQSRDTRQVERVVETVLRRFGQYRQNGNGVPIAPKPVEQPSLPNTNGTTNGTTNGVMDPTLAAEPSVDFDWTAALSQPMIDESWNWLENFLQDDSNLFLNGDFPGVDTG